MSYPKLVLAPVYIVMILSACASKGEVKQALESSILVSADDFRSSTGLPLRNPIMIAGGPDGTILISDNGNGRIVQVRSDGSVCGVLNGTGLGGQGFILPADIEFNQSTKRLWVLDRTSRPGIYQYSFNDGNFVFVGQAQVQSLSGLTYGTGIVSEPNDAVWVSPKLLEYELVKYDSQGAIENVIGDWWLPRGVLRQSLWVWNMKFLFRVGMDSVGVAWIARPVIEVLNRNGVGVAIDTLQNEYTDRIKALKLDPNQVREYCYSATYCGKHGWLVWQPRDYSGGKLRIHLHRLPMTEETVALTARLPEGIRQVSSLICIGQSQPEFVGLDRNGGQLVVFRTGGMLSD